MACGRGSSTSTWRTGWARTAPKCLDGTDFGEAFDEQLVLNPGMVAVFEPVIWEDGAAGYRSGVIVAANETSRVKLSDSTYDPYGFAA